MLKSIRKSALTIWRKLSGTAVTITAQLKVNGFNGPNVPKEMYAELDAAGVRFCAMGQDGFPIDAQNVAQTSVLNHAVVYRSTISDVADYTLSPYDAAVKHWALHKVKIPPEINKLITWIMTINEPRKEVEWADWLGHFETEMAILANADGYKYLAFGFASGTPDLGAWETEGMIRYLNYCAANPDKAAVGLHEYSYSITSIWTKSVEGVGIVDTTKDDPDVGYLIGRFTKLFAACDQLGIKRPYVIITEWGWTNNNVPNSDVAMSHILEVGELYAQYLELLGAAIWYLGSGYGGIAEIAKLLISPLWNLLLNTTYEVTPPDPPTPDPECEGLPREDYTRVVNVLHPDTTPERAAAIFNERWGAFRETVTGSYDDAGIGALTSKTAVLWDMPEADKQTFIDWYADNYPGTIVIFKGESEPPTTPNYLDVPALGQCDPAWSNELCGTGPKTICQWGCLLTAYTMWLQFFNANDGRNVLQENARFVVNGGFSGSDLVSMALSVVYPNIANEGWMTYAIHGQAMHDKAQAYLANGIPVPARVDFDPQTAQWEQHWVLLVGWDANRADYLINDPWGGKKAIYLTDYYNITGSDVLECIYYQKPNESGSGEYTGPPIEGGFVRGVDNPASDWYWPTAKSVFDVTGLAVHFHTAGNNYEWYEQYKHPVFNIARNFDDILTTHFPGINNFYGRGCLNIEGWNEPNLAGEGLGTKWVDGADFGAKFKAFCLSAKAQFPNIRIWFPGMSPQYGGQFAFIDAAIAAGAFELIWGVCEHVYTAIVDDVNAAVDQMFNEVMLFRSKYGMERPLAITEFAVNAAASAEYKAAVYRAFLEKLATVEGIQAAYSFTSSWHPTVDPTQQDWLVNGIHDAYANLQ